MTLLRDEDRKHLENEFSDLETPVRLVLFTQQMECQYCSETRQLTEELSELSQQIELVIHDLVEDAEIAEAFDVDKIPALVIMRGGAEPKDYGIRFYGIPSGYEFATVVEDIKMVARGDSGLTEDTKSKVAAITQPVHLQVFVTPTCPYCPRAVLLAHQLAFEGELIKADMVEAIEFPHLSMKYQVQGVPRTVINEDVHLEGAAPEAMVLAKIGEAI